MTCSARWVTAGSALKISRITAEMDVADGLLHVYGRDGEKLISTPAIEHLQEVLHRAAVKNPE
jgi:hypothetical protein